MSITALEATSFVGRRRELTELHQSVASARLVTLIGIGGSGKTRLAQRLLRELRQDYDGRVWMVDLGQVHDPDVVQLAVAAAMGLRPKPGENQVEVICGFVGDEPALVVLDNCEHLLGAGAALASEVMAACPQLQVVATSRQALGIAGELVYRVPPMPVPRVGAPVRTAELAQLESVSLFVGRAGDALPGFALTDANAETVARLCAALEGIPLALELAAARIRVLSPEAMLDRIEQRYELLSRGFSDVPDRQRSMEASVEWSHELCSPAERTLWRRLSVFRGGFDLDAAETVCAGPDLAQEDVLDVLSALVDKSLVYRDPEETHPHFRILELIRQYGAARLAEAEDPATWQRRHQEYFSGQARQLHDDWVGPHQPRLVARMRRNHANLQAVLEHTGSSSTLAAVALRMAVDLEDYWAVTGLLTEGRHWLDSALEQDAGSVVERSTASSISGYFAALQAQLGETRRRLAQARRELESVGDGEAHHDRAQHDQPHTLAWARLRFAEGVQALYEGRPSDAEEHCRRSIELFEAAEVLHGLPVAHVVLGICLSAGGRSEEAAAAQRTALSLTEPRGELHIQGLALWALSVDARTAGDLDRAADLARRSLQLRAELGDDAGVALAIESLASITAEQGDATLSATLLGAAMRLWDRVGLDPLSGQYVAAQRVLGAEHARRSLGDRAFGSAHRRGRSMPVEEAVDLALGRAHPGDAAAELADTPLTARERQVAALIGEGLSNQQIATRLVISVRTAQGHVEKILRKLGFSSRTQVATWVVGRR